MSHPNHQNIEIKARCQDSDLIRGILKDKNARFIGVDSQTDVYFKTNHGRLKLRKGNIENCLIFYDRENKKGPKHSKVILFNTPKDSLLESILRNAYGVLVEVKKKREIYFIDNVKFHIDEVEFLGNFVEIEAIDKDGSIGKEKLMLQCREYMNLFKIQEKDLIQISYSDLLLKNIKNKNQNAMD